MISQIKIWLRDCDDNVIYTYAVRQLICECADLIYCII